MKVILKLICVVFLLRTSIYENFGFGAEKPLVVGFFLSYYCALDWFDEVYCRLLSQLEV